MDGYLSSDLGFTSTVKEIQARKGSREFYLHVLEARGGWETMITPDLQHFIENQISMFMATANKHGQPYIQHKGGPPGFLRVLDEKTLGFADFVGNRQYISQGNLFENDKAQLFLIDYGSKTRIKIWGRARVIENDKDLVDRLMPENYGARPEQAILFDVSAWDANCAQHIPLRFEAPEVSKIINGKDARIRELETEVALLKAAISTGNE